MSCAAHRHRFWITNHLVNPVLRVMLRGPWSRRFGHRLAVLRYEGRHTGVSHELIVQYATDGNHVWIVPGHPERKQWWRNMLTPRAVELWLAGRRLTGTARVTDTDAELRAAVDAYQAVSPRAPRATLAVRIELDEPPTE
ncbi:MAG TPA: nitroreductase/quinone reductase family protein [Mycobacterium sp.]|jgi:hypothetical protein|nr:nitroreductase/quinone reductase family protein [Mycobacterium sp.]